MKKTFVYVLVFFFLTGCASPKKKIQKSTKNILSSRSFQNQFTGFLVVDPETRDTLLNIHGKKYFTPASNTKIFTLFTALKLLPDSIPALKYLVQKDTLYVEGTGDPTLLHSYFNSQKTIGFLKQHHHIALYLNNFAMKKYGPGWAWEDYQYFYQPERSGFPLYGNIVTINYADSITVVPSHFKSKVTSLDNSKNRELGDNTFYFPPSRKDTIEIPFKTDSTITRTLFENVLNKKVRVVQKMPEGEKKILYNVPSDSVYKRMMHESDNFLAEQLLILASSTLSDTLDGSIAQDHILKNELADLRQPPRWVDGSGLSRYNLFTPESIVYVLYSMYSDVSKKRLFELFPEGGASNEFTSETPYIYAKTGSLGNNYCLSGYLRTKSGKTLIFSFMNNHFRQPSSEVKRKMQLVLEEIRDTY